MNSDDSFKEDADCTMDDCLRIHFQEEKVDDWNCEHCSQKTTGLKKLDLWRLPSILIIHLKRFVEDPKYGVWTKLDTFVDYPVDSFDLSPFTLGVENFSKYELFAVSNHFGSTDSGHYTAFCKRGEKWYHFDDELTTPIEKLKDLVTKDSYLLFYRKIKSE